VFFYAKPTSHPRSAPPRAVEIMYRGNDRIARFLYISAKALSRLNVFVIRILGFKQGGRGEGGIL